MLLGQIQMGSRSHCPHPLPCDANVEAPPSRWHPNPTLIQAQGGQCFEQTHLIAHSAPARNRSEIACAHERRQFPGHLAPPRRLYPENRFLASVHCYCRRYCHHTREGVEICHHTSLSSQWLRSSTPPPPNTPFVNVKGWDLTNVVSLFLCQERRF